MSLNIGRIGTNSKRHAQPAEQTGPVGWLEEVALLKGPRGFSGEGHSCFWVYRVTPGMLALMWGGVVLRGMFETVTSLCAFGLVRRVMVRSGRLSQAESAPKGERFKTKAERADSPSVTFWGRGGVGLFGKSSFEGPVLSQSFSSAQRTSRSLTSPHDYLWVPRTLS